MIILHWWLVPLLVFLAGIFIFFRMLFRSGGDPVSCFLAFYAVLPLSFAIPIAIIIGHFI